MYTSCNGPVHSVYVNVVQYLYVHHIIYVLLLDNALQYTTSATYCTLAHELYKYYTITMTTLHLYSIIIDIHLVFLGAAAGSPYIVFKLTFSYGFMLRIYIYIYI